MKLERTYECPLCKRIRIIKYDLNKGPMFKKEFPKNAGSCLCTPNARFLPRPKF